jgi:hypothetical protein
VSDDGAVLDLGTYELKPGAGEQFAHILEAHALPMLARFGIEVVAYGRSLEIPTAATSRGASPRSQNGTSSSSTAARSGERSTANECSR